MPLPSDRGPGDRPVRVGVVGTGFMAAAHTEALRRLGHLVVAVAGRTSQSAREAAARLRVPAACESLAVLLADADVDVVHVTTPNDLHAEQVAAVVAAGKHVVCEKPLGVTSAESAETVRLAQEAGVVNAVCFNLRFAPHLHHAAALVAAGDIGEPWLVHGGYLQDWLLLETDWNWRLVSARQGGLRAVADIGSHWLDLARFVTGRRVEAVLADLHTFVHVRERPQHDVRTFEGLGSQRSAGTDDDAALVREPMSSDDAAGLLLRFEGGLRGVCTVSQVSAGRKNRLTLEVDGAEAALAFTSEDPELLWVGHRGRPNELVHKDPSLLLPAAARVTGYPAGHVEGYPDTFKALFAAVYEDVAAGAPSETPAYPTFADGHETVLVCEAIAQSARDDTWVTVRR